MFYGPGRLSQKGLQKRMITLCSFFAKLYYMGKMKKVFLFLLNLFTHSRDRAEKESHKTYFAKMNVRIFYNDEFFSVNDLMHFEHFWFAYRKLINVFSTILFKIYSPKM